MSHYNIKGDIQWNIPIRRDVGMTRKGQTEARLKPSSENTKSWRSDSGIWSCRWHLLRSKRLEALYHNTQGFFLGPSLSHACSPPQDTLWSWYLHTSVLSCSDPSGPPYRDWISMSELAPAFPSHLSDCWGRKTCCLAHWPSHHRLPCHDWLCSRATSQEVLSSSWSILPRVFSHSNEKSNTSPQRSCLLPSLSNYK